MNLAQLTAEMRAMGIRSLAIELDTPVEPTYTAPSGSESAPTEAPEAEPKQPDQCAALGCSDKRVGLFGGSIAGEYCRAHAAQRAGL